MAALFSSSPRILRATARHRVVVGYAVAPSRVASQLPPGLVPDTRDGRAFITLVAVQLVNVRVLDVAVPGVRRVPAVELQVPVREAQGASGRRGTKTIQAHVSRRMVAWGARRLYGEPVAVTAMQPVRRERADGIEITYRFDSGGREQRLRVYGRTPPVTPSPGTRASFLLNRGWRYGVTGSDDLLRTRVERPLGAIYRVQEQHVTVRWASVYGEAWAFLQERDPTVVLFSPGTPVTLRWPE